MTDNRVTSDTRRATTAPRRASALDWFGAFAFFVVLAGDVFRYGITWFGWIAVVLVTVAILGILLARRWHEVNRDQLPYPLFVFCGLTVLSIAWSNYRLFTLAGSFATIITVIGGVSLAIILGRERLLWALGTALKFVLGLSLVFEFIVSVFVRHPVLPWWVNYGTEKIHPAEYWSRDLLFTGDRIQGIVGNSNLLGFAALLGLIVFAIQLAARTVRVGWGLFWLAVAALCILLTRSATVTVALVLVVVVWIVLYLIRRTPSETGRRRIYLASLVVLVVGIIAAIVLRGSVLALLNKSQDLTGRTSIWGEVIRLAGQRPIGGWGWISYWFPGIPPFNQHKEFVNGGVQLLQAHNAWLDVWFQLGIIGLLVFGGLMLSTTVRAWILAVDLPFIAPRQRAAYSPLTLLPILVLVALLAQSLAESRLLIEYGMLLVSVFAVTTKRDFFTSTRLAERRR